MKKEIEFKKQQNNEKEEADLEFRKMERRVNWIKDILIVLNYVKWNSRIDLQKIESILIDIVSGWCILCLKLENGIPESFHIIPRRFIETDQKGILEGLEAYLSGVSGTSLFVCLQRTEELFWGDKAINAIPIKVTFASTDDGYLMVEMKA